MTPDMALVDEPITGRGPSNRRLTQGELIEQARNIETVGRFLDLLEAEDIDAFMALWADETRQDMPYPPPGFPSSLVSKASVDADYRSMPQIYESMRYTDRELFATQDSRVVIARFKGNIKLRGKPGNYDNRYLNIFVFDADGLIVRDIEHFNPLIIMNSGPFDGGGGPLAGTSVQPPVDRVSWARDFFATIDRRDPDAIAARVTEDARLVFGGQPPVEGRKAVRQAFAESARRSKAVHHEVTGVWTGEDAGREVVSVEARVTYTFAEERAVAVPCTSTLRLEGDLVADYRIFIDLAPVFGPAVPHTPKEGQ